MCHQLLCCFGTREPENRPSSRPQGASISPSKASEAINEGAQAPSQRNNASIDQGERQEDIASQDQIREQGFNGKIQEKPIPSPNQGEKQQKDTQVQQNEQELDGKKQSKIPKALSFKPKAKEEKPPRGSEKNVQESSEENQKVFQKNTVHKEQGKYSPYEQEFGSKIPEASKKEQQQVPSPPKEQVHPSREKTDEKVSAKTVDPKGRREFEPSEGDSKNHEDK